MDDLSGPIMFVGLVSLLVLVAGCAGLVLWQRRYLPSSPAVWAGRVAFVWGYFNFIGLAFTPAYLVPRAILNAILWGGAITLGVWLLARLRYARR